MTRFVRVLLVLLVTSALGCRAERTRPRPLADAADPGDAGANAPVLPDAFLPGPDPEDAAAPPIAEPGSDASTPPSPPPPDPLGELRCLTLGELRTSSDARWGARLTDIVRHQTPAYGDTYYDADTVTYGHEATHGIHAYIRNTLDDTGQGANGFYVMDGRACLVREPRMRKSDVGAYVPASLRWSRFDLYVTGASDWDDRPLYVWDEWVAYTNGAEVGVDRQRSGLWTEGWRGTVDGVIELSVYAIAVGMAAEASEPGYFEREPNFGPFLAWNLRRAMRLFREGRVMPDFAWDEQDAYFERFRSGAEAEAMRAFVRRVLGDGVADEILAPS